VSEANDMLAMLLDAVNAIQAIEAEAAARRLDPPFGLNEANGQQKEWASLLALGGARARRHAMSLARDELRTLIDSVVESGEQRMQMLSARPYREDVAARFASDVVALKRVTSRM
jgi:hypothetical protein